MTDSAVLDADAVRDRTRRLISDHRHDDQTAFLGAQYDAGLAWIQNPVGFGGLGLSPSMQGVVDVELEEAGRRADWMRNPMGIGMVGPAIAVWGTDDQRGHLRRIFTAEDLWCQLFSEPGAGSDVATLSTRAERDGDEWVVNGQKVWTSLAHRARYGLLLARTNPDVPKHRGITAFIVDMHAPGVEVRPLRQLSGDAEFNEVYFTEVRVADSARVGGVGDGWRVAVTTLMNERVSIGGSVAPRGSGRIAFVVDAWNQRADRDRARRDAVMRCWVDAEVNRLNSMRAQERREQGTPGPEGSVLKLAQALADQRIMSLAVDLHGAHGMLVPGYGVTETRENTELSFLRAQASTIAGGTTEIMKNILGERVLGLPGDVRVDKDVMWRDIPKGA